MTNDGCVVNGCVLIARFSIGDMKICDSHFDDAHRIILDGQIKIAKINSNVMSDIRSLSLRKKPRND